jgi:hypothetical protein
VGLIPVKPVVKENMVQAFFSFYRILPSKYYGKKQRKIWRRGGHFKNFKHLPNSGGKNTLVTFHLITLKNNSKQVFNLYTGWEFGKHLSQVCVICID